MPRYIVLLDADSDFTWSAKLVSLPCRLPKLDHFWPGRSLPISKQCLWRLVEVLTVG